MSLRVTRRDFLKVAAGTSLVPLLGRLPTILEPSTQTANQPPNIIIVLFDALSAEHLSVYGYARKTCNNLERLAKRSFVYHRHHSAGNFTAPSTASLFTGTYPWIHRVFSINGIVNSSVRPMNLLNLLPETYSQAALVQNMYADILVYQLRDQMTAHLGPETGSLVGSPFYNHYFPNDAIYGAKIYDQFLFDPKEKPGSLFLSIPVDFHRQLGKAKIANQMLETYPEGLPYIDGAETYFTIEGVMQDAAKLLRSLPAPFFAYLHFMPPHAPYRPNSDYLGQFDDGWAPESKKHHPLATRRSTEHLNRQRQDYDEYIANLDAEFGELLDGMDKSGMLDNSYLIVTSDHGDLFERGAQGHVTPLLFEAITHIPLLISTPGQRERRDIHHLTSNVDLLPTLLKIVRKTIPESCEGRILPGLGDNSLDDRKIFSIEAKKNHAHQRLKKATVAMWQGQYKLIQYMGYKGYQGYEFYDLENDPDELIDLFETHPEAQIMKTEMERQLEQTDKAYR